MATNRQVLFVVSFLLFLFIVMIPQVSIDISIIIAIITARSLIFSPEKVCLVVGRSFFFRHGKNKSTDQVITWFEIYARLNQR